MKSSKFNIIYENRENEEIVIFNTLHGSITVWNQNGFQIAEQLLQEPNLDAVDEKTKFVMNTLVEEKYIIDDEIDEIKIVENRKICGMKDEKHLDVVIIPNMTCNFACPYCFESHVPDSFMNDETEQAIKQWLKKNIPKYKTLSINWFGGEPLLSFKRIVSTSEYAKRVCDEHNTNLRISITTNGYLLSNNKTEELVSVGILDYHITMDGTPEFHNKTRISKDGKDSFLKIFENLVLLARADDRVCVCLRVNFNHFNVHAIPQLLSLFPIDIRHKLSILYEPIFGNKRWSAKENLSSAEIASEMLNNYCLAQQMGYNVSYGKIDTDKTIYCPSERENYFVFNYNGDIFKCPANLDSKERFAYVNYKGDIVINEKQAIKWFGLDLFEGKCYSCTFLPLCMGGCRNMRLTCGNTGDFCSIIPQYTVSALKTAEYTIFV